MSIDQVKTNYDAVVRELSNVRPSSPAASPVTEKAAQLEAVQNLAAAPQKTAEKPKAWHERAIAKLDEWEAVIDEKIPHITYFLHPTRVNEKIDQMTAQIEKTFAKLDKFNQWIDSNGNDKNNWFEKLAIFLCKLPVRVARNILRLLYQVVKTALYAVNHPVKSLTKLAKLLVKLAYKLTLPETWTQIGVGLMGASIGQALAMGNPLAPICLIIGAAMVVGGVSAGAIKAAVHAEKGKKANAAWQNVKAQAVGMPETFATSFVMGLIFGAIQRSVYESKMKAYQKYEENITNYRRVGITRDEAMRLAEDYARVHGLPKPSGVVINHENGYVRFDWTGDAYRQFISDSKVREFFLSREPLNTSWPRGPIRLDGATDYQVNRWGVEIDPYPARSELTDYAGRVTYSNTDLYRHMHGITSLKESAVLNVAGTSPEVAKV